MEKGFNDDELADIMNEIESLEKEFTEEVEAKKEETEASTAEVSEPVAETAQEEAVVEPVQEEVVAQTAPEPEEDFEEEIEDSKPVLNEDPLAAPMEAEANEEEAAPVMEAAPVLEAEKEVLHEVVNKPVEEVVHLSAAPAPASTPAPAAMPTAQATGNPAHTSMSFNVEGDMRLSLSFNISGKLVQLSVNDDGLELEMDGGMKFSVPLEHGNKNAA